MNVAIIGAGNVGRALATAFTRAGHRVTVTARHKDHAVDVAKATGANTADSARAAADGAEIVVLAIPFASAGEVASEIRDVVAGKPVVDVSNRMSYGPNGPDTDTSSSNAEELAVMLPDAKVVKAFNTLFSANQVDPVLDSEQLDGFVAGDDPAARDTVLDLVESVGLNPVNVGPLARARQLEALAFLNIALQLANDGTWRSGWKLVAPPTTR